jgi:hypothetical protein
MYLTSRDNRVLRFIEDFNCATVGQIHRLFFSDVSIRSCQRRLTTLTIRGVIRRERAFVSEGYLYYLCKRPLQVAHNLARVDAYIALAQMFTLYDFIPEYKFGRVKADAYFEIWRNGKIWPVFLEVQRARWFDQAKYDGLYSSREWRERWREFPLVVALVNRPVRLIRTNVRFLLLDLENPRWELLQKEIAVTPAKESTAITSTPMGTPKGSFVL